MNSPKPPADPQAVLDGMTAVHDVALSHWDRGVPLIISTTQLCQSSVLPFSYTVGLPKLIGQPEICVSGLDQKTAELVLTAIFDHLRQKRLPPLSANGKIALEAGHLTALSFSSSIHWLKVANDDPVLRTELKSCPGFGHAFLLV